MRRISKNEAKYQKIGKIFIKKKSGITLIALVITIIVLLILASITIGAISGDNGILNNTGKVKEDTEISQETEILQTAVVQAMGKNSRGNLEKDEFQQELDNQIGKEGEVDVSDVGGEFEVFFTGSERYYTVDSNGNVSRLIEEENTAETPAYWEKTTRNDSQWYSYADISNGNEEVEVNAPKLRGAMTPIKYVGEDAESQTGSKWANAITADGSMWVWIPRYAYKITSGYHEAGKDGTAGTIEIAFIDTENNFLNGETGVLVTDPSEVTYTDNVQNEWLVHPVFTSNAENGGGFGELTGIWVGKFETTGNYDSSTEIGTITVMPGEKSLSNMTINQQYKSARNATFGENFTTNSHMAKNSEWGAVAYLAHSKYGVNAQKVHQNTSNYTYTGGTSSQKDIYTIAKTQSTTFNAYGVYDMDGGSFENVASYVDYGENLIESVLLNGGYGEEDSLLGKDELERATSTAYKMVYKSDGTNQANSYNLTENVKGDGIWETSLSNLGASAWFSDMSRYPVSNFPFFQRSGYFHVNEGIFLFREFAGSGEDYIANGYLASVIFRVILAF